MIAPGQTIGILGGGSIARLLTQAAQTLGYRVHIFEPREHSPATAIANAEVNASYEDLRALKSFAEACAVVTCESENIPIVSLEAIAPLVPLCPPIAALLVGQNRQRGKAWLHANGFPHVRYAEALQGDIAAAVAEVGRPCVVKTADFGSEGQGQMKIVDEADLEKAGAIFRGRRCVVERWIEFSSEVSVLVGRGKDGAMRTFPATENIHAHHVLEFSIVPARVTPAAKRDAELLATAIADKLGVIGVLAVEMFVTTSGEVLVNELAARPHNSGHWSLDGGETSQFEQHIRAICGLPLGAATTRESIVMANLPGDLWRWQNGRAVGEPNWAALLGEPGTRLYLYGEAEPRPGRKMGHFTVRDTDADLALARAREIKARL